MNINAFVIWLVVVIAMVMAVSFPINITIDKVQDLDFESHFKPKKQRRIEKCSKCGRKILKGEYVGCEVDYHGHTKWYCEECDKEVWGGPNIPPYDDEEENKI